MLEIRYSGIDRILHRIAFSTGGLQLAIADIEDKIFKADLSSIQCSRPVFITALPRAGTTLLLNLLVSTGEFASHVYRDMPFVLCPMFWQRFSRKFHIADAERKRAHADGLLFSVDSPEAFDEIVWMQFWRDQYKDHCIETWKKCNDEDFKDFFQNHIKKIVAIRNGGATTTRYVSKNNMNIARLECLPEVFPDAIVLVPFRDPIQHACSMLKQHLRFLSIHKHDRFVKAYMAGIGHYEFGQNLRPINFKGWINREHSTDSTTLDFWLEYWIAAYEQVLESLGGPVRLISFRALTEEPESSLATLAEGLGLSEPSRLIGQAGILKTPEKHTIDLSQLRNDLVGRASKLTAELEQASIL